MISEVIDARATVLSQRQRFRSRKEYELCLKIRGRKIESYVDGELSNQTLSQDYVPEPLYCSTSVDGSGDIIVKAVNVTEKSVGLELKLDGLQSNYRVKVYELSNYALDAENSFDNPDYIIPKETEFEITSASFSYKFSKYSLSILRMSHSL